MEESTSIRLVSQFLHDHGFQNTLEALQKERCFAEWCIHVNKKIKFGWDELLQMLVLNSLYMYNYVCDIIT